MIGTEGIRFEIYISKESEDNTDIKLRCYKATECESILNIFKNRNRTVEIYNCEDFLLSLVSFERCK